MDDRTLEYILRTDPSLPELWAVKLNRRFKALLDYNVGGVTLEGLQLGSSGPMALTVASNLSGLHLGDEIEALGRRLKVKALNIDPMGRGLISFAGDSGLPGENFAKPEDEDGDLSSIFYTGKKAEE